MIRVRMAPSPTGYLHLGSLRTALFNWLFARHNNGVFLIRIEDTDAERSKQEYLDSILDSFKWADITPDEPIVIQSKNVKRHLEVAQKLLEAGLAYRCYCTQEELELRLGASSSQEESFIKYDRKCCNISNNNLDNNKPFAIRFKIPDNLNNISFKDLIRGDISFDINQFGDFIIVRSDNLPVYNFVVVVDDADMKITHVIRGEDHIPNTPKQILLYKACGFKLPEFAHLPLILGEDGQRLSKRHAATAVIDYKNNGFLPDALCNYLVRLGWSHGDQEIFTKEELIKYFSLDHVGKKSAIFDVKKLEWVNGLYIRNKTANNIIELILRDIDSNFLNKLNNWNKTKIEKIIDLYKDRVKTLKELVFEIELLYYGPKNFTDIDLEFLKNNNSKDKLIELQENLFNLDIEKFNIENLNQVIKNLCEKLNIKLPDIAKPLRIAFIGKINSPGIFELLEILGKKESMKRLENLLGSI